MLGLDIKKSYMTQLYLCFCLVVTMLTDLSQSLVYTDGKASVEWVTHGLKMGQTISIQDIKCYIYNDRNYTAKYPEEGHIHTDSISISNMIEDCVRIKGLNSSQHHKIGKRSFFDIFRGIYPGTKWCGAGNIADGNDEVGSHERTDVCCRDHDNCDTYILSGETKYGAYNDHRYTIMSCECDEVFKQCLDDIGNLHSGAIELLFFTILRTPCVQRNFQYRRGVKVELPATIVRRSFWSFW